jgi:hypothetical protein
MNYDEVQKEIVASIVALCSGEEEADLEPREEAQHIINIAGGAAEAVVDIAKSLDRIATVATEAMID